MSGAHLTSLFEVVVRAVTGLYHTVASIEAGDEDHAEAVEVAVGGAAPLVLDLGRCVRVSGQLRKCWTLMLNLNTDIVQVGLSGLRCFGRPGGAGNLGITIAHLL